MVVSPDEKRSLFSKIDFFLLKKKKVFIYTEVSRYIKMGFVNLQPLIINFQRVYRLKNRNHYV